jgi:hypothetical protein
VQLHSRTPCLLTKSKRIKLSGNQNNEQFTTKFNEVTITACRTKIGKKYVRPTAKRLFANRVEGIFSRYG